MARKLLDNWERQLELKFDLDVRFHVFSVPFTCTMDFNLKWFQFRLIHRVLGTFLSIVDWIKTKTKIQLVINNHLLLFGVTDTNLINCTLA